MVSSFSIIALIVGGVFGSFFNVIIYRLPNSISLIFPPSHCPVCKNKLKWYHNIPVVSYLLLKGKCAYCGSKIPISYLFVESISSLAFFLLFLKDGLSLKYVFDLSVFSIMLIQSVIDFKYMEVPAILNDLLLISGVVYLVFYFSTQAILFSLSVSAFFIVLYILYKNKFGIGDVKIFIALSLFFEYDLFYIILISSLVGIIAAAIISHIKNVKLSTLRLPFIPYIFIGVIAYWITLVFLRTSTLMNLNI